MTFSHITTASFFRQFLIFIKKQASCALFGGLMLFFLILSKYIEIPGVYRYDALFIVAIIIQIVLIVKKLEEPSEVRGQGGVILAIMGQ